MNIYLLQHSYELGEFEETKIIGIYSSDEMAKIVIEKYKMLPGFREYPPDCFTIDMYTLDANNWEEGFVSWEEANS